MVRPTRQSGWQPGLFTYLKYEDKLLNSNAEILIFCNFDENVYRAYKTTVCLYNKYIQRQRLLNNKDKYLLNTLNKQR